jgi:hypothetical protein
MTHLVGEIYPSEPNKYSCFKNSDGKYYKCTYDNFKKVYFKWELNRNDKETIITVPSYIPSFLHNTYLKFKLGKPVYLKCSLAKYYSDWETERINNLGSFHDDNIWDQLIINRECYVKKNVW